METSQNAIDIEDEGMDLDVPLFLMSQFCDSALKEPTSSPSLFSNVFSDSVNYRPKRREHSNSNSLRISIDRSRNNYCVSKNEMGNVDPESQQIRIERKLCLSNHVKTLPFCEYLDVAVCLNNKSVGGNVEIGTSDEIMDLVGIGQDKVTSVNHSHLLHIEERLQSYLPILKNRIENGKWAGLRTSKMNWSGLEDQLTVFYGVLEKPNSVKPKRLEKLYDHIGVASLPLQSTTSKKKQLFLINGTHRVALNDLTNDLKYDEVVSGIPLAAIGRMEENCFNAEEIVFATPRPPEWPLPRESNIEMVFVSGLFLGSKEGNNVAVSMVQDYLLGLCGSAYEQKQILAQKTRLFLVGNSVSKTTRGKNSFQDIEEVIEDRDKNMDKLDEFLEPILSSMEVFLIPGESDPTFTSSFLPQPPLHHKLLPMSSQQPTLKRLTSPSRLQISVSSHSSWTSQNGTTSKNVSQNSLLESSVSEFLRDDISFLDVLLQSGKNIKDSMDYCNISCPIEMALKLLKWGHLHPTCCDAKETKAEDIYRIQGSLPNLVIIGNLSEFKVLDWNGTKIIGVPSFHKTNTAVVLTKDFDIIPLSFKVA